MDVLKSERTHHVQHQSAAVTGRHAAGVGAMRRGAASEAEIFFRLIVFGNRETIAARSLLRFAKSCKIAIANSLKTRNRKSPENESREWNNANLKTRVPTAANRTELSRLGQDRRQGSRIRA
jgi:hypothetical protein